VLSHELRNPLAPIANAIHLIERVPPDSEEAARARVVIERQTAQLTRLVDDLLDLTRIERGKVVLKPEVVDLREIVKRTCDDYRGTFDQRGVELHVTDPVGPVIVRGDPARLAQIIGNLLHNSWKFTPAGGVVTLVVGQAAGQAERGSWRSAATCSPRTASALARPGSTPTSRSRSTSPR
jgi:signal transduction histidine kinase